jgi:hypothetical protein
LTIITNIEENCNKKIRLTSNFLCITKTNTHIFSTIYPQTYAQWGRWTGVLLQRPPDVVESIAAPAQAAGAGPEGARLGVPGAPQAAARDESASGTHLGRDVDLPGMRV